MDVRPGDGERRLRWHRQLQRRRRPCPRCEKLGLKGLSEKSADISSNKFKMKKLLWQEERGAPATSASETVRSLPEALEKLDFPVVIKAVDLMGSSDSGAIPAGRLFLFMKKPWKLQVRIIVLWKSLLRENPLAVRQ